jgi:hypothetical protein
MGGIGGTAPRFQCVHMHSTEEKLQELARKIVYKG